MIDNKQSNKQTKPNQKSADFTSRAMSTTTNATSATSTAFSLPDLPADLLPSAINKSFEAEAQKMFDYCIKKMRRSVIIFMHKNENSDKPIPFLIEICITNFRAKSRSMVMKKLTESGYIVKLFRQWDGEEDESFYLRIQLE